MKGRCPVCKGEIEEVEVPTWFNVKSKSGGEKWEKDGQVKLKVCKDCRILVLPIEEQDHD